MADDRALERDTHAPARSLAREREAGARLAGERRVGAEERGEHLFGTLMTERVEPELRVVGLVTPLMGVLGPVVDQHQDARGGDAFGQQTE